MSVPQTCGDLESKEKGAEQMTTRGNYKGNPTITLGGEGKYPFTFGVSKAKMILAHIKEIRAFVADNERGMRDPGEDAADRWNESEGGGR